LTTPIHFTNNFLSSMQIVDRYWRD